ncbi:hypothetical protein JW859_13210 [bacterium]|nr:hypothetical protein [bacterium]
MQLVHDHSLAATLDAINEAFFYGHKLTKAARTDAAKWLAARQGLPRSYAGMFAPTEYDYAHWPKTFTGEKIGSNAATGHILGEEACRALIRLAVDAQPVREALARASENFLARLNESQPRASGFYCCGTCTASFWRHLAVGGLDLQKQRLASGLKHLAAERDGRGRWRRFPFHYTVWALSEIDLPAARRELTYAAPVLERIVRRHADVDEYGRRRLRIAELALARC